MFISSIILFTEMQWQNEEQCSQLLLWLLLVFFRHNSPMQLNYLIRIKWECKQTPTHTERHNECRIPATENKNRNQKNENKTRWNDIKKTTTIETSTKSPPKPTGRLLQPFFFSCNGRRTKATRNEWVNNCALYPTPISFLMNAA